MKKATLEQAGKILSIFKDTPSEKVQAIIESGLLVDVRDGNLYNIDRDVFRKLLGLEQLQPAQNANIITVKSSLSLSELIKARRFDSTDNCITDKRFPTPDRLWNDYKEFHFGENISSEKAVKQMRAEGYDPANSHELLLWNGWNGENFVIALGSVAQVSGSRRVLCLYRDGSGRSLGLRWWGGGWYAYDRFLAVRR